MNDCEFTLSLTALANSIANRIDDIETLDVLSNSFMLLGDTLGIIAVRREVRSQRDNSAPSQTKDSQQIDQGDSRQHDTGKNGSQQSGTDATNNTDS